MGSDFRDREAQEDLDKIGRKKERGVKWKNWGERGKRETSGRDVIAFWSKHS